MSDLDAATATRLLLDTAEAGGSAAVAVVVGGAGAGDALGRRLGRTRAARGGDGQRPVDVGVVFYRNAVFHLA